MEAIDSYCHVFTYYEEVDRKAMIEQSEKIYSWQLPTKRDKEEDLRCKINDSQSEEKEIKKVEITCTESIADFNCKILADRKAALVLYLDKDNKNNQNYLDVLTLLAKVSKEYLNVMVYTVDD